MSGVAQVNGRRDEFVGIDAAAVLGRAVTAARHAHGSRAAAPQGQDRLELDDVLPVVAEVIVVKQLLAGIHQDLVQPDVLLGDPGLAFFYLKGAQVMLSLRAVTRRPGAELVQVPVGPAEGCLDDLVDLIEKQVRGQLQPPPERRPGPPEVDPETVGDDLGATRPPP